MACTTALLTGGYQQPECANDTAGVWHNRIWLATLSEVLGWTASANPGEYEDVTFGAGDGFFELVVEKDTAIWSNGYDEPSKSFFQSFSFRLPSLSLAARNFLQSTKGVDMVLITHLKAGVFEIVGKDSGCQLFSLEGSSDGENVGYSVEFRAQQMDELSPHFLDTDVTTTLTTLASKVTTT